MTTTARVDFTAAHVAILQEQAAATPALLVGVYPARPGAIRQTPLAYVDTRSETITHDAGTRTRLFSGSTVVLVDTYTDNTQTADRLDQLVDALVDRYDLPANVSKVPGTIIELTSVADTELSVEAAGQATYYRAVVLTFGRTAIKEGRQ